MSDSRSPLPRVSVVIPVYKGEAFVETAIRSALEQTHTDVEVIAVDDGSPDDSLRVLQQFADRIRILSQKNTGVAGARNRGIEASTGTFIAFLDQDDWWRPTKIERQLEIFAADPRVGLVHTAVAHIESESGREVPPMDPSARPEQMIGECFERLVLGNPMFNSSVMVRRGVIAHVGACDPELAGNTIADYDLWLRIARHYRFGYVADAVTCYRRHADQGMYDRRAMLSAELGLMLRIRDEASWCRTGEGRARLAGLHDALAVACLDSGDIWSARRRFLEAMRIARSRRSTVRWAASLLPQAVVRRVRQ